MEGRREGRDERRGGRGEEERGGKARRIDERRGRGGERWREGEKR